MVVNPISTADIMAYVSLIPICDPPRFLRAIRRLDKIWLEWSQKKSKSK